MSGWMNAAATILQRRVLLSVFLQTLSILMSHRDGCTARLTAYDIHKSGYSSKGRP